MPSLTASATSTATATTTQTPSVTPSQTVPPTVTETPIPPEPGLELIFEENFDFIDYPRDLAGIFGNVVYDGQDFVLLQPYSDHLVEIQFPAPSDVVVQAEFTVPAGAVRLNIRETPINSYSAVLDANGGVTLYRSGIAVQSTQSGVAAGQPHMFRVSAMGDLIRIAVDNVEVLTFADPTPLVGGLVSFKAEGLGADPLRVDDITLWAPAQSLGFAAAAQTTSSTYFNNDSSLYPAIFRTGRPERMGGIIQSHIWAHVDQNGVETSFSIQPLNYMYATFLNPEISPDGNWVAHSCFDRSLDHTDRVICVMNITAIGNSVPGAIHFQVTTHAPATGWDEDPTWSPDGQSIMYRSRDGLRKVDVDFTLRRGINDVFFHANQCYDLNWEGEFLFCRTLGIGTTPSIQAIWINELGNPVYTLSSDIYDNHLNAVQLDPDGSSYRYAFIAGDCVVSTSDGWTFSRCRPVWGTLQWDWQLGDWTFPQPQNLEQLDITAYGGEPGFPFHCRLFNYAFLSPQGDLMSYEGRDLCEINGLWNSYIVELKQQQPEEYVIIGHVEDWWSGYGELPVNATATAEMQLTAQATQTQGVILLTQTAQTQPTATLTPIPPETATAIAMTLTAQATPYEGNECEPGQPWWRNQTHDQNEQRPEFPDPVGKTQSHHGVNTQWMETQFGDFYHGSTAPTVLMPDRPNHNLTRGGFNTWRATWRRTHPVPPGTPPDQWSWKEQASWQEIEDLANDLFEQSHTPQACRDAYWDAFREMVQDAICEWLQNNINNLPTLPQQVQDIWQWLPITMQVCNS